MRATLGVSTVIALGALVLSATPAYSQQMSVPIINPAMMQQPMMQQSMWMQQPMMQPAVMQRAVMQRALMERAVMQRAVMQRAAMQRATLMSGLNGTTPAAWGAAFPAPFSGWGGNFGMPGYGGFAWDPYWSTPGMTAVPTFGTPVTSYVP